MITSKYLYVTKVKVKHIKEVIEAYNAIDGKGFIKFEPTGLFSGYVNVLYGSLDLSLKLSRMTGCVFISDIREVFCFPCGGNTESCSVDKKNENDIALKIKETVDNLNRLIIEAQKEKIHVCISQKDESDTADTPPLQVTAIKLLFK